MESLPASLVPTAWQLAREHAACYLLTWSFAMTLLLLLLLLRCHPLHPPTGPGHLQDRQLPGAPRHPGLPQPRRLRVCAAVPAARPRRAPQRSRAAAAPLCGGARPAARQRSAAVPQPCAWRQRRPGRRHGRLDVQRPQHSSSSSRIRRGGWWRRGSHWRRWCLGWGPWGRPWPGWSSTVSSSSRAADGRRSPVGVGA